MLEIRQNQHNLVIFKFRNFKVDLKYNLVKNLRKNSNTRKFRNFKVDLKYN